MTQDAYGDKCWAAVGGVRHKLLGGVFDFTDAVVFGEALHGVGADHVDLGAGVDDAQINFVVKLYHKFIKYVKSNTYLHSIKE